MEALSVSYRMMCISIRPRSRRLEARTDHLEQNISRGERVSLLDLPARDSSLSHGGRHGREEELSESSRGARCMKLCRSTARVSSAIDWGRPSSFVVASLRAVKYVRRAAMPAGRAHARARCWTRVRSMVMGSGGKEGKAQVGSGIGSARETARPAFCTLIRGDKPILGSQGDLR